MQVELDFSILDGVPTSANSKDEPKAGKVYYKLEAEEKLRLSMEEAAAKQLEVYAAHQDAILKAGQLTNDITKGIQAGQNPFNLLLKAVKCISLMTGNDIIYDQAKDDIKKIYGIEIVDRTSIMEAINTEELEEFLAD